MANDDVSLSDLEGAWMDCDWESGLVKRCKSAWSKPLRDLSREDLAIFLRQHIAVEHLLPIAKKRLEEGIDDNTEMYEGELSAAIEYASNAD